jgi:AmmeMemoRadiSam system protein A
MAETLYLETEQHQLLEIARATLEAVARSDLPPYPFLPDLPPALQAERACFVTLTQRDSGDLRGCTGTLVARNPLAIEVVITTRQTALNDPRFPPVTSAEVPNLHIEISILTPMQTLDYADPTDLLRLLQPGIDGVTLQYMNHRATFLPQVWERVPGPTTFLDMLCHKMGLPADTWRRVKMQVFTYRSVVIEEPHEST